MSKKFRSMIVMYPNGMKRWRVGCTGRRSLKGANPWVHSLQKMMKFQTSLKVFIILCLFLLMILKWNVGRLYLKEATGDLVKGFGPLIQKYTEILFQRYWWTTRRFFHQKLESHWSILSTASEKLAQQYFFGHSHCSSASWKQTTRKTTQDKRSSIDPHVESHWAILFATFSRTGRNLPAILGPTSSWRLIRITRNPWSEPARNLWKSTENRNIKIIKHQQEPPKSCILMKKCSKELCLSAWFIFTCPSLIGSLSPGIWILSWRWEFRNV